MVACQWSDINPLDLRWQGHGAEWTLDVGSEREASEAVVVLVGGWGRGGGTE